MERDILQGIPFEPGVPDGCRPVTPSIPCFTEKLMESASMHPFLLFLQSLISGSLEGILTVTDVL